MHVMVARWVLIGHFSWYPTIQPIPFLPLAVHSPEEKGSTCPRNVFVNLQSCKMSKPRIHLSVPDARTRNAPGLHLGCAQFKSQSLYRLHSDISLLYLFSPSGHILRYYLELRHDLILLYHFKFVSHRYSIVLTYIFRIVDCIVKLPVSPCLGILFLF
jgi:hypothetical protein